MNTLALAFATYGILTLEKVILNTHEKCAFFSILLLILGIIIFIKLLKCIISVLIYMSLINKLITTGNSLACLENSVVLWISESPYLGKVIYHLSIIYVVNFLY